MMYKKDWLFLYNYKGEEAFSRIDYEKSQSSY